MFGSLKLYSLITSPFGACTLSQAGIVSVDYKPTQQIAIGYPTRSRGGEGKPPDPPEASVPALGAS